MPRLPPRATTGLPILLLLGFSAYLGYKYFRHEPETLIACEFALPPGGLARLLAKNPGDKLRIEGRLEGGYDGLLFGSATWPTRDASSAATVSGGVVLSADHKRVDGISLGVAHPRLFGREGLRISTLNSDGNLDNDRSKAFLYLDGRMRLSYPVPYACRIDRREARWDWPWR